MTTDDRSGTLADDLSRREDADLVELFGLRPDLATPPPQGTGVLAQRAVASASISLAGEDLDLLAVAVLELVIERGRDTVQRETLGPVALADLIAALDGRAPAEEVTERVTRLRTRALLWGPDEELRAGVHVPAALPWRAPQVTGPLGTVTAAELQERIDSLDERRIELLTTLARGPALGRSRDAAEGADPAAPVPSLIASGLLSRVDEQTVELPPQVGRLLTGQPPLRTDDLTEPPLTPPAGADRFTIEALDASGGGEAVELLRHTTSLLEVLGIAPAAVLRSGGLGVREKRRLAKATGLPPKRVALILELLAQQRLIGDGFPDPPPADDSGEHVFAPTTTVDGWLYQPPERRWAALVQAWLAVPRRPWQVGEPDRDGNPSPALSADLYDAHAPAQRLEILAPLADAPEAVGATVESLTAVLAWRRPRHMRRTTRHVVDETLREATELGLVAHGALTRVGRAVFAGTDDDTELLAAMAAALPEPVDHFLTQADLTLTVPGPMTPELADQVEAVADLESAGAASVYRVTENSLRRAFDAGRSGAEILAMFTKHSRTPVPQGLTYLVEDVARRHGSLRVGIASAFVRCEDASMMAAVLRSPAAETLALRALAPTVAVTAAEVREVIEVLREAGFSPAGEDSAGALVDLSAQPSRVAASTARRATAAPARRRPASPEQLISVVSRMRSHDLADAAPVGDAAVAGRSVGGGSAATALIQLALRAGRRLRIDYVDAHGSASRHVVRPSLLAAGRLTAVEVGSEVELEFSLHRITAVELIDNPA